jgi:hypothetical protein
MIRIELYRIEGDPHFRVHANIYVGKNHGGSIHVSEPDISGLVRYLNVSEIKIKNRLHVKTIESGKILPVRKEELDDFWKQYRRDNFGLFKNMFLFPVSASDFFWRSLCPEESAE